MLSISSLLTDPNPDDPLESEIADEYNENRPLFIKNAKQWTEKFAKPKVPRGTKRAGAGDKSDAEGSKKAKTEDDDDDVQVLESKSAPPSIDLTDSPAPASAPATAKAKPPCKYGAGCYRKNPHHLQEFSH